MEEVRNFCASWMYGDSLSSIVFIRIQVQMEAVATMRLGAHCT